VFAAGVALRRVEQHASAEAARVDGAQGETRNSAASRRKRARLATAAAVAHADPDRDKATQAATHPQHAPAFMAHAVLSFNEQIERIAEVVAVIRPVAVLVGLVRSQTSKSQRGLIGWFGIRGIGSLFYLAYAIDHGLAPEEAETMTALVLSVIVVSIVVHGISVTPLMAFYERRKVARSKAA
jgi:hypothetical protein